MASTPESLPKRERDDLPTVGNTTSIGSTSGSVASEKRSKADSPTGSSSAGLISSGTVAGGLYTSEEINSGTTTTTASGTSSTVESVTINGQIGSECTDFSIYKIYVYEIICKLLHTYP